MKERPILFSTPMVRAILEGRKSQTRRIIKPQPKDHNHKDYIEAEWKDDPPVYVNSDDEPLEYFCRLCGDGITPSGHSIYKCPYGQPGDVLWVRETWFDAGYYFIYRADSTDDGFKWKPSIFMPKEASRLKLKVANIRVERLQDITGKDAVDEGIEYDDELRGWINYNKYIPSDAFGGNNGSIRSYKSLWESINGKGSWEVNPWVWVIEFEKL